MPENPKEIYTYSTTCTNCSKAIIHEIPKGTKVDTFLVKTDCPNCGVKLAVPELIW